MKENKKIIIIVIILILLDQILKLVVFNFGFNLKTENGFGIILNDNFLVENNIAYILISFIAIYLILKYIKSNNSYIKFSNRLILSFALSGAISNLIDRIWLGYVICYISIPFFTSLNLGYFYIIITWVGLAILLTKYTMKNIKRKSSLK